MAINQQRSTNKSDILRAVVVMCHSTLEDFLRSVLRWKLPESDPDVLNKVNLAGNGLRTKIEFKDIVKLKGKTVDEVVEKSINEYLSMVSFNDPKDISVHLLSIGVELNELQQYFKDLNEMIKRRHNIVHKADRTNDEDISKTRIKTIRLSQVERWKDSVDGFVTALTVELRA